MTEELKTLRLDVAFTSLAHQIFMSCTSSNKRIIIYFMETSGRFQGEVTMNGDGHMQRPSSFATDPPVEHANASSDDVKGVIVTGSYSSDLHLPNQLLSPSLSSSVSTGKTASDNINAKSSVDDPPQLAPFKNSHINNPVIIPEELANLNDNMEESTPYTYQQQQDEQTYLEPTNAPPGDVESSTVSSSHSYLPPSKESSHYMTTSEQTGSDQGTANAATAGLPLNERRGSYEQREQRKYTVHCLLHGIEKEPCNYDETFASEFEKFLSREPNAVPPTESEDDDYMWYIEDHLKKKRCPSFCAQLWKFCTANNLCNLYKFADEGLLLHSKKKKQMVGSICTDFAKLKNMTVIGKGAFGKVYLYTSTSGDQFAIKKEIKHPLINSKPELFKKVLGLKHPHVVETLEYLVAHSEGDKTKSYLLVMPFMNRKGLDKQFKKDNCDSVLAYMVKYPDKKNFIFRNFLEIFHQVFKGLDYLKRQKLVHRDVKSSNILVQQNCSCVGPLMCTCLEGNTIHCVLGDMNLLCNEGESSLITSEMWHRMALHEPAGTPRMKAPESYYRTGEGDPVIGHKSDVWSGCVTMINALVGKEVNEIPDTQIGIFLRTATLTVGNASKDIDSCSDMLESIINKYPSTLEERSVNAVINGNVNPLLTELQVLHEKLDKSSKALKNVQAFQGGVPEARDKESPLAGILFTVYVANNLHWKCFTTLPHVYNTRLWDCLCDTLAIITDGVRFIPENRKDASEIVELLKQIKTAVML